MESAADEETDMASVYGGRSGPRLNPGNTGGVQAAMRSAALLLLAAALGGCVSPTYEGSDEPHPSRDVYGTPPRYEPAPEPRYPPVEAARVRVPNLTGVSPREAGHVLDHYGLTLGSVSERLREGARYPLIGKQSPHPGAWVPAYSRVSLTLDVPAVRMPDLRGVSLKEAKHQLAHAGLRVGKVKWESRPYRERLVFKTKPRRGELVERGTDVKLFLVKARK